MRLEKTKRSRQICPKLNLLETLILCNLFNKRTKTYGFADVEIASFPAVVSGFYHLLNLVMKNTLMFISVNVSFLIE